MNLSMWMRRGACALCLAATAPAFAAEGIATGLAFGLTFGGAAPAQARIAFTAGSAREQSLGGELATPRLARFGAGADVVAAAPFAPAAGASAALVAIRWRPAIDRTALVAWSVPLSAGQIRCNPLGALPGIAASLCDSTTYVPAGASAPSISR